PRRNDQNVLKRAPHMWQSPRLHRSNDRQCCFNSGEKLVSLGMLRKVNDAYAVTVCGRLLAKDEPQKSATDERRWMIDMTAQVGRPRAWEVLLVWLTPELSCGPRRAEDPTTWS